MLTFIYDQQRRTSEGLRFKALMEFCNCDPQGKKDPSKPAKCSYRTLMNYKKELMSEKLLKKKIDPESGRPLYCVTKKGREKVEKQRIKLEIDLLAEKWFNPLRNLFIRMKKEDPNVALDRYCFTFIGEIPTVFTKSVENMESHIAFERSVWERHARELERFKEEWMKAGANERSQIDERIREEVGWSPGEYFKKLLQKAEKEKGIRKIMTIYGITEEMLEEMYKAQGKVPTEEN